MNIMLVGPPGAGKGTQSRFLMERFTVRKIATGDLLRSAIASGSEIGKKAKDVMAKGELVGDDIVLKLVQEEIKNYRGDFLFDGYPRNIAQADQLMELLESVEKKIDVLVVLNIDDNVLVDRLCGRLICKDCAENYHITNKPSLKKNVCDLCDGELIAREDDNEKTIRDRILVFNKQTKEVVCFYEEKNIPLVRVDANQPPSVVLDSILEQLPV